MARKEEKRRKSMQASYTTINVSHETKAKLESLKFNIREPYDSVINRMISALKSLLGTQDLGELRTRLLEYEPNEGGAAAISDRTREEAEKELRRLRG